jgi:hypothetical protein
MRYSVRSLLAGRWITEYVGESLVEAERQATRCLEGAFGWPMRVRFYNAKLGDMLDSLVWEKAP